MSWDVMMLNLPDGINKVDEIPDDLESSPLCSRKKYEDTIFELFPKIDQNGDRSWMILEGESFSIEFNSGTGDDLNSLMLHVRGDSAALGPIERLCNAFGWKAFDCSLSDIIDFSANPDEGFSEWRDYRDKVMETYAVDTTRASKDESKLEEKKWWKFWK